MSLLIFIANKNINKITYSAIDKDCGEYQVADQSLSFFSPAKFDVTHSTGKMCLIIHKNVIFP